MDDPSSSGSSLEWHWTIEYLSRFRQLDPSILHHLIDAAPMLSEHLGESTREMVSLRCLEQLFGTSNGVSNDVPSVTEPKHTIDFSGTCEDALKSILKETSVSDLRMSRSDLLKWDIHSFISHKRASMSKCALEKLKDAIFKGNHPCAASLTELRGLVHNNDENDEITVDSGNHNAVTGRIDSDDTNAQIMAPEASTISLPLENKNGMVGHDSHCGNLLPLKRNGNYLDNENPAGEPQEDQGGVSNGDLHFNVKRFKSNISCTEQIFMPLNVKELVEDERMVGTTEKESCHMETESQVGGLGECRFLENGHDEFVATEGLGRSPNAGVSAEFQNNQCENAHNANKMPSDTSGDEPSQHILVDDVHEAEHMETESQVRGLGECRSLENGHDEFVATEELGRSLNAGVSAELQNNQCENAHNANKAPSDTSGDEPSQHILVDDVHEAEHISLNRTCVRTLHKVSNDDTKANNYCGSQLKSSSAVSLDGFHRDAAVEKLGGTEHFYQEDTSNDGDDYHLGKVDVAMEKSHFLSSECTLNHVSPTDWTELHLCVKCSKEGQLLVCNAVGCPVVVHKECLGSLPRFNDAGSFYCPFCAYALAISGYMEAKKKASLARRELSAFIHKRTERSHSKEPSNLNQHGDEDDMSGNFAEGESDQTNNGGYALEVNGQLKKSRGDKRPVVPMVSCCDTKLMDREEEPDVTRATIHVSPGEKEREEIAPDSMSVRGLDRQDQNFNDPNCNGDNPMPRHNRVFSLNEKEAEVVTQNVLEQQTSDSSERPVFAIKIDQGDISDERNEENMISNYSISFRRRKKQYVCPAMPQLRRKKVHWTAEEEEMLKEGVQKFSNIADRWKKILEYGSSVFLTGRTAIDLKDKWRNMCKRRS